MSAEATPNHTEIQNEKKEPSRLLLVDYIDILARAASPHVKPDGLLRSEINTYCSDQGLYPPTQSPRRSRAQKAFDTAT